MALLIPYEWYQDIYASPLAQKAPPAANLSRALGHAAGPSEIAAYGGMLSVPNAPSPQDLFRTLEENLGPYGDARGVKEQVDKWKLTQSDGAKWLIARIAEETDLEILTRAATVLSEIGEPAIWPVISWISSSISDDLRCALLQSIAWMPSHIVESHKDKIVTLISAAFKSSSVDVREKAVAAAGVLPTAMTREVLSKALRSEREVDLQNIIRVALSDLRAEQG